MVPVKTEDVSLRERPVIWYFLGKRNG